MQFNFLAEIDEREKIVLRAILRYQIENGMKGIMWTKLCELVYPVIPSKTFSRVIKDLVDKKAIIGRSIEGEKKHARFYEIVPIYLQKTFEFYQMSALGSNQKIIDEYVKECDKLETKQYVSKMMLFIMSSFYVLPFYLIGFENDFSRWLYNEANNLRVEDLLKHILNRSSRSTEDKKDAFMKLFEMLKPFSNMDIGVITEAEGILKNKEKILELIIK